MRSTIIGKSMNSLYPWQTSIWQLITKQVLENRCPHAILCKGPRGLGKVDFANQLAQFILCEQKRKMACGECRSCHLFLALNHPDFYSVQPLDKSKNIKIDQVRELSERLTKMSQRRGFQVALISPLEMMNVASGNALLKTLEEPQGSVILILVANQLASVPATMISRCQTLHFNYPKSENVLPWLQEKLTVDTEKARQLFRLSGCLPLLALEIGQGDYVQMRDSILKIMLQLLANKISVIEAVPQLLKQDLNQVLQLFFSIALDVMRLNSAFPEMAIENQDRLKPLNALQGKINVMTLAEWLSMLIKAKHDLTIITGLNVQLLLETLLLQWQKVRKVSC
jgi:DNA polymerase III subunit delta'